MLGGNKHLNGLILGITLSSLSIFLYKWLYLQIPLSPATGIKQWTVEAKINYRAKRQPVKLQISIPEQQPNFYLLKENFISPNYGILTKYIESSRFAIWTSPYATGYQSLYYRAELLPRETRSVNYKIKKAELDLNESELAAADAILDDARKKSADVTSLASQIIIILNNPNNQNTSLLLVDDHSEKHIVEIATKILARADVPAAEILGIRLDNANQTNFVSWLMVISEDAAKFIDPTTGQEDLPNDFLIWHIGSHSLYTLKGGYKLSFRISKSKKFSKPTLGRDINSKLQEFSLDTLPLRVQSIYQILLTIPIGALIILIFRNFIGLPTFGIFMPVLIALALLNMSIAWGCFLFSSITAFGLAIRFYMEKLQLLVVPRLSAILICVILFIAFLSVITNKLGFDQGVSVTMFPIVILTMTIERMCNLWDEQGAIKAIQTGLASLLVAIIASVLMAVKPLQYLLFHFPELNLLLLALILTLGQYRGYRLTELSRFKSLAG